MITADDIERVSVREKPSITEYTNCGYINRILKSELEETFDIAVELVVGGIWQSRAKREEHAFLRIPRQENVEGSEMIVDGSIKQFCEANRHDLFVVLGPRESLPEVAVLQRGDAYFSYFTDQRP